MTAVPENWQDKQPESPLAAIRWPISTGRLTLRPATNADAKSVWEYRSLDSVANWLSAEQKSIETFQTFFDRRLPRTVVVKTHRGTIVGDIMVKVENALAQAEVAEAARDAQAELGWVIDPQHRRNGYATEAVQAAIAACFTELNLRRVTAKCFGANYASMHLMERLGMDRESYHRKAWLHRNLGWQDYYEYALLAAEWMPH